MPATAPPPESLVEMPLWRLLVLLADIERDEGPSSPGALEVARAIDERLRGGASTLGRAQLTEGAR